MGEYLTVLKVKSDCWPCRQLEWLTNFFLVVVSLFGISIGTGLMAFYKLHLLSFISIEFFIVPVILLFKICDANLRCGLLKTKRKLNSMQWGF